MRYENSNKFWWHFNNTRFANQIGILFLELERGEEICNTSNNIIGISIHISQNEKSCDISYFSSKATNTDFTLIRIGVFTFLDFWRQIFEAWDLAEPLRFHDNVKQRPQFAPSAAKPPLLVTFSSVSHMNAGLRNDDQKWHKLSFLREWSPKWSWCYHDHQPASMVQGYLCMYLQEKPTNAEEELIKKTFSYTYTYSSFIYPFPYITNQFFLDS